MSDFIEGAPKFCPYGCHREAIVACGLDKCPHGLPVAATRRQRSGFEPCDHHAARDTACANCVDGSGRQGEGALKHKRAGGSS